MSNHFKLKRGFDIRLKGAPETGVRDIPLPVSVAIKPTDFHGLTPKICTKAETRVKAGDPLFFDKHHPDILFTSPVSGIVKDINRGERRKILEVVIASDGKNESREFVRTDPFAMTRENIINQLLTSGLWPFLKQRPYGILASPTDRPKHIFISGFDSAPLAPDYEFIFKNEKTALQTGINALAKLTDGSVFMGLSPRQSDGLFSKLKEVSVNIFEGPHPAGNVGVHVHHVSPVFKNDKIWTISMQGVVFIGRLFDKGTLDFSKLVALTGSEVKEPKYIKTIHGASLTGILAGATKKQVTQRYISGNVLTGTKVESNGFLGFFDEQITVIPEGDEYEFLGWASPGFSKFSPSSAFLSKLFPKREYVLNANMHGSERAYVMTGQYEKFMPMDILPVYLIKAIMANDIDKMEQLGIYEVIEEDMALCEYADTSKIKVQEILRKGIQTMIKEM